jgi:putative nucleotidyltransferase with HDIG domain
MALLSWRNHILTHLSLLFTFKATSLTEFQLWFYIQLTYRTSHNSKDRIMDLDRDAAWQLLTTHTTKENLLKHALAVEAAMKGYARHFDEDEELWGITGLLHDIDYEKHPNMEEHPLAGVEILKENGYPEILVQAVLAHAPHTGALRETTLAKALFAVDELTGFIVAVALVRPSKSIADVKIKSVTKKFKDRSFAALVNREDIIEGAEDLGMEVNDHVGVVLEAMKGIAGQLGLEGSPETDD